MGLWRRGVGHEEGGPGAVLRAPTEEWRAGEVEFGVRKVERKWVVMGADSGNQVRVYHGGRVHRAQTNQEVKDNGDGIFGFVNE